MRLKHVETFENKPQEKRQDRKPQKFFVTIKPSMKLKFNYQSKSNNASNDVRKAVYKVSQSVCGVKVVFQLFHFILISIANLVSHYQNFSRFTTEVKVDFTIIMIMGKEPLKSDSLKWWFFVVKSNLRDFISSGYFKRRKYHILW